MADPVQLAILRQDVEAWNTWRRAHPRTYIDLSSADLSRANLYEANLKKVNLNGAKISSADLRKANLSETNLEKTDLGTSDLSGADLSGADLIYAILSDADLSGANLSDADLGDTDLDGANFSRANLSRTTLIAATLREANLSEANLSEADLGAANFNETKLDGADFSKAIVRRTIFAGVDLRTVKGLETVEHRAQSTIGINTIILSAGDIPEKFLRGAGVSDTFITYIRSLIGKPIEYYSCFISYSSKDQEFVERLYADLQSKGVRCWFAPEDLKTGDKIRDRIDQSIRVHDKLLLVLSEHSVNSSWVEFEVEAAIVKENSKKALMLFPIRLDSAIKDSPTSWAAHIRRTRHITDFSNWKQHDDYQKVLKRLLRDLKAETTPIAEKE